MKGGDREAQAIIAVQYHQFNIHHRDWWAFHMGLGKIVEDRRSQSEPVVSQNSLSSCLKSVFSEVASFFEK